jgi:hypothetical protein
VSIVAPAVPGTTSVSTYVTDALLQATVIGFDQIGNIPDPMSQLVLRRLTRMIGSWSNDFQLSCYATNEETFTMVPSQAAYSTTLLPSGRPQSIHSMFVRLPGSNIDFPVTMRDQEWFEAITYKPTPAIPSNCYYNAGMPNGTLNFYPTPYAAFTCFVERRDALNKTTTLTLTAGLSLPPGYDKAIVDCLAMDIFPSLKGSRTPIPPDIRAAALEAKRLLRVANYEPLEMESPFDRDRVSGATNGLPYRGF